VIAVLALTKGTFVLPVFTLVLGAATLIAAGSSGQPSQPVPGPVVSTEGSP
jgi:hypothetical protein